MSLRLRFMLWYGVLFALILICVGLLSYAFHARSHYDEFDRMLVTSAEHAAAEATTTAGAPRLVEDSGGFEVALRLYNRNGVLQEASVGANGLPLIDPQTFLRAPAQPAVDVIAGLVPPFVTPPSADAAGTFGVVVDATQRWRTYVQPLYRQDSMIGYIEALMPLGQLDSIVQRYRMVLLTLCTTGLVAAVIGSGAVTGRALQPIALLTQTAQVITHSRDFSRRIEAPPQRDELGQLAATFNDMLASLEEAYRAQQRFVADASHELRAPLTAIQGNLELIQRHRTMLEADRAEALAEASREAARLSRLVADLLALARADAGVPIKRQAVDLDTVVLDAFSAARQLAHGQTLVLEPFEAVQVVGDADRLKQLVLILLDNAIKYTPAAGSVTLGLRHGAAEAEIRVRDTGVGIPDTDLPHVFERFYRADPARGRDPGGTGLGLPIAKWIVEQHGGTITVTSHAGQGTPVTVRLPMLS